jgi:hypothetical protein
MADRRTLRSTLLLYYTRETGYYNSPDTGTGKFIM